MRRLTGPERRGLDDRIDALIGSLTAARRSVGRAHEGRVELAYIELDFAREQLDDVTDRVSALAALIARVGISAQRSVTSRGGGLAGRGGQVASAGAGITSPAAMPVAVDLTEEASHAA